MQLSLTICFEHGFNLARARHNLPIVLQSILVVVSLASQQESRSVKQDVGGMG